MNKRKIRVIYLCADILLAIFSIYAAAWLRFDGNISPGYYQMVWISIPISATTILFFGRIFGTYKSILQYLGFSDAFRQLLACAASTSVFFILKYIFQVPVSGSITAIYFILVFTLTTGLRLIPRFRYWLLSKNTHGARPTLVIGAGTTGAMVIKRLEENPEEGLYPIAAVDDDVYKLNLRVAGVPVAGTTEEISAVIKRYNIKEAILAIPSIDRQRIISIQHQCVKSGISLKVFQSTVDIEKYLAGDKKALKPISVEDLLFRDSVRLDKDLIYRCVKNKTVMVTGGAGSIGSEVCRQALSHGCKKLIILDINENGLFELNEELKKIYSPEQYDIYLGSIRDKKRLECVFENTNPELVFHAAAHKHVPLMEENPFEAIKNNILGTENVLEFCRRYKVARVILISTDKAVNPTSMMGATKRAAELLVQLMNSSECIMTAVRFGNVLGSNGSVIPVFEKQIKSGGPVTVTHKDMERYFITIPEAVSLVMIAGTIAEGGEIFVLDMGKPIKIYDLACEMIRLSGLEPEKDIKVVYTGLRPGEKMFEEISLDEESVMKTAQEKIFILKNNRINETIFKNKLEKIKELSYMATEGKKVKEELMEAISSH